MSKWIVYSSHKLHDNRATHHTIIEAESLEEAKQIFEANNPAFDVEDVEEYEDD